MIQGRTIREVVNVMLQCVHFLFFLTCSVYVTVFNCMYHTTQVALLSGPPGLGKTTLAHIIAKHAGYNVVEINAR